MATKSRRHRASSSLVICLLPTEAEACLQSRHIHKITRVPPYAFEFKVPYNIPYVFITSIEAPPRTPLSSFAGNQRLASRLLPTAPTWLRSSVQSLTSQPPSLRSAAPLCLSDTHRKHPLTPLTTPTIMHHLHTRRYVCCYERSLYRRSVRGRSLSSEL